MSLGPITRNVMKSAPISYIFLALTGLLFAATVSAIGRLHDLDGDIIFGERSYYVLPFIKGQGQGGGLTLAGRGDKPCPLNIVQESSDIDKGLPVKFSNWYPRTRYVPDNGDLNIETQVKDTNCSQATYWWVDEFDNARKQWFLTTGPKPEGFGEGSLKSYFQILGTVGAYAYRLNFCPKGSALCSYVGMTVDENGVRRLTVKHGKPLLIQFKKAN